MITDAGMPPMTKIAITERTRRLKLRASNHSRNAPEFHVPRTARTKINVT